MSKQIYLLMNYNERAKCSPNENYQIVTSNKVETLEIEFTLTQVYVTYVFLSKKGMVTRVTSVVRNAIVAQSSPQLPPPLLPSLFVPQLTLPFLYLPSLALISFPPLTHIYDYLPSLKLTSSGYSR